METIRKKICFDKSLSHRNGLVPFFEKDSENGDIVYVTGGNTNGNYGNFACDFVLIDAKTIIDGGTGLEYMKKNEISRLRYLDIIRNYNKIKDLIKSSVIVRKVKRTIQETTYTDCIDSGNTSVSEKEVTFWTTRFTENIDIYDFIDIYNDGNIALNPNMQDRNLIDISYFTKENDYDYCIGDRFVSIAENVQTLIDNGEEVTDEHQAIYDYVMHLYDLQDDDSVDYCILVYGYDFIIKCDEEWENWWQQGWDESTYNTYYHRWEQYIFGIQYVKPANLKFFYDVEKYLLGRIKVPEVFDGKKIEGTKVPEIVTVLNYMDYKLWFETNEQLIYTDNKIKKEWENRGGNAFYNFLNDISPIFMQNLQEPTHGNEIYFTYAVPNIELSMLLDDEFSYESEYKPYEYSIDINGNIVDGTYGYTATTRGIGSGLTPGYSVFEDGEINCESKLGNLASDNCFVLSDEIYGVFCEFQHSSQLFKCTYHTGCSSTHRVTRKKSVTVYNYSYINGEMVLQSTMTTGFKNDGVEVEEVKPKVVSSCYQVTGIEKIGVEMENELMDDSSPDFPFLKEELFYYNDTNIVLSAYTYEYYESSYEYSWWECSKVNYSTWSQYSIADGEEITNSQLKKYKNVIILSCIPYIANDKTDGHWYYFMARYDNGNTNRTAGQPIDFPVTIKSLDIPYTVGQPMNIMSYDGEYSSTTIYDVVESVDVDNDNEKVTIQYVIGKTSGSSYDSGIRYKETFPYSGNCCEKAIIDGIYDAEIYYNKLFIKNVSANIDNDTEVYRGVQIATITGMEIGTQWTSASCINAPLITEEISDGMLDTPNVDVSIVFDRGSAAAWEKHFKLSECNTLEDLENYGNGAFFNT